MSVTYSTPRLAQSRALHVDVESYLIDLLRRGELKPGDRISEVEVARQLGISRTPVREALVRLIKDGVLVHLPRRGAYVARPSREAMEEIASFRVVVEGFAARQAARRARPEEIACLAQIIEDGAAAARLGDWLTMEETNAAFHDQIVTCAHHGILSRVWGMIGPMGWKLVPGRRPGSPDESTVSDFVERHRQLLDAIASGDPDRAERAAVEHVQRATAYIIARTDSLATPV